MPNHIENYDLKPTPQVIETWERIYAYVKSNHDEIILSYLKNMSLQSYYKGTLEVSVPTIEIKNNVYEKYYKFILDFLTNQNDEIKEIRFVAEKKPRPTQPKASFRRRKNINRMEVHDSNGPDVRIRGTAHQVVAKYLELAKDAASAGDRVLSESYLQHAQHFQNIINAFEETTLNSSYYRIVSIEEPRYELAPLELAENKELNTTQPNQPSKINDSKDINDELEHLLFTQIKKINDLSKETLKQTYDFLDRQKKEHKELLYLIDDVSKKQEALSKKYKVG